MSTTEELISHIDSQLAEARAERSLLIAARAELTPIRGRRPHVATVDEMREHPDRAERDDAYLARLQAASK